MQIGFYFELRAILKQKKIFICDTQICVVYVDLLNLFCLQSREYLIRFVVCRKSKLSPVFSTSSYFLFDTE